MLPSLTTEGALPPGVHSATLAEVIRQFGIGSEQRKGVTRRLQSVLQLAERTGQLRRVFLWGSYITAKEAPNDVDLMLVMAAGFRSEACVGEVRQVSDCEVAEKQLGATVLWTREDVPSELLQAFLEQWQIGRGGVRRGIVEVMQW